MSVFFAGTIRKKENHMQNNELQVIHSSEKSRFEVQIEPHIAQLNYRLGGNAIIFTHTGVPPALEGRGIGSLMVKAGLEYARKNNLKVQSLCWFVSGYLQRHAEYRGLLE
jgi:uncharacterized protein